MKLAVVVGHNKSQQGAIRHHDGVSEFVWNSDLAKMIQAHDPKSIKIFFREAGAPYTAQIDKVYKETDQWGATATVELHFNGSSNPEAAGTLTLSSGTTGSMALANLMQAHIHEVMQLRDRGVEVRGRKARGGRSLWQGRAPAVMLEPYFGSHLPGSLRADAVKDELAEAVYRAALAFHNEAAKPQEAPEEDPELPFLRPEWQDAERSIALLREELNTLRGTLELLKG